MVAAAFTAATATAVFAAPAVATAATAIVSVRHCRQEASFQDKESAAKLVQAFNRQHHLRKWDEFL